MADVLRIRTGGVYEEVSEAVPLPVAVVGGFIAGGTVTIPMFRLAGVDLAAYTAGDALGDKFGLPMPPGVTSGIIQTMNVVDRAKQSLEFDVVLFSQNFTATTNNAAFDPTDADLINFVGVLTVTATDYKAFNDNSAACVRSLNFAFAAPSGMLWAQCVARGAIDLVHEDDLWLGFGIIGD